MCILFLYVNPKPSVSQFRLILAANRDEAYKRPAKPAHVWDEDHTVIGGRDMEPGKEGGTWLALSKTGRIAALLNVMHVGEQSPELIGRGGLVSDFVKGNQSGLEYLQRIAGQSHQYRPFNFITVQINPDNIKVYEYCNVGKSPQPVEVTDEYLGISNSLLNRPFAKVKAGVIQFKEIIDSCHDTASREKLSDKLLNFLKQKESHFPDPELISYSPETSASLVQPFSSVFVDIPQRGYGTRAHSIITVDSAGRIDFSEWALREPINRACEHWDSNHFVIHLDDTSQ